MTTSGLRRATLALLVHLFLGACSPGITYIDGFPVGQEASCDGDVSPTCEQIVDAALRALNRREPDHAPIDQTTIHTEDESVFPQGTGRSGSLVVVVFGLADGTQRAAGAYCGPGADGATCWPMRTYDEM